ncbi:MAG TPA: hypothetical protein VNO79_00845 [Actinomycetota bacterium]|nr:hypothetical protein [Actinomycetota bacterium]
MGRAMAEWEARCRELLGNPAPSRISQQSLEEHVRAAVRRFSSDRPRIRTADYPGNGSTFELALPSDWVTGFSQVQAVEYPQGEREPVFLDLQEVVLYPPGTTPTVIRLTETTPASGKTARVYYSVPWPIPDANPATDLIPATDFEAVASLAAAGGALELAGRTAGNKDPEMPGASAVDFRGESDRWRSLARDLLRAYAQHMGAAEGGASSAAEAITDWDARASWAETGRRFLLRWPRR